MFLICLKPPKMKFCGEVISEEIVSEVKDAKFFSILADEAMDESGKEQLSFVLRYVNSDNEIQGISWFCAFREGALRRSSI